MSTETVIMMTSEADAMLGDIYLPLDPNEAEFRLLRLIKDTEDEGLISCELKTISAHNVYRPDSKLRFRRPTPYDTPAESGKRLETSSRDDEGEDSTLLDYVALSHCWGSETADKIIRVDGRIKNV